MTAQPQSSKKHNCPYFCPTRSRRDQYVCAPTETEDERVFHKQLIVAKAQILGEDQNFALVSNDPHSPARSSLHVTQHDP
eukprot:CAMPEP_0115334898 /NCGR_PEP_ID=MMETSP0270-20121206/88147_1 /TAXON_ID=71861 /ORGANISM="Scrippsiella trochoidea, Strain CCMP3099" /LENGTH=79 /DNA_ID=CAMNT_0002755893 /DNA_START=62 /DNA_END=301 /DNA_ORIENTATION=-